MRVRTPTQTPSLPSAPRTQADVEAPRGSCVDVDRLCEQEGLLSSEVADRIRAADRHGGAPAALCLLTGLSGWLTMLWVYAEEALPTLLLLPSLRHRQLSLAQLQLLLWLTLCSRPPLRQPAGAAHPGQRALTTPSAQMAACRPGTCAPWPGPRWRAGRAHAACATRWPRCPSSLCSSWAPTLRWPSAWQVGPA